MTAVPATSEKANMAGFLSICQQSRRGLSKVPK